ncbi:MAG: betaine/proline/choline family ABC transporter ATP-binding protein [Bacillota bacterium]
MLTKVITFENVSKVFDGEHVAVEDLTLEVEEGELVVLIGPSGCGKTTTLQMVNRLIEPTGGTIRVNGRDTSTFSPVELRRSMGYVIQEIGLFPHMTVSDNISVVPDLKGWKPAKKRERARELMDLVGMDPDIYSERYPRQLSGGQQQRIGVLRALAVDPDILLMDEPFGALDPLTRDQLQEELVALQERVKKTVLFVTHDMDEALKLADRIVLMREGRTIQVDKPDQLLANPADEFVSEFIGTERMIVSPLEVCVSDVMLNDVPEVKVGTDLRKSLDRMKKARGDYLAVVNGRNQVIGLTSADRIQRASDDAGRIEDVDLISSAVRSEASIMEAVHCLAESGEEVLAVVDNQRHLVGTFTRGSLPRILIDELWPLGASDEIEVNEISL